MKRYGIEVEASNRANLQADTLLGVQRILARVQGTCSVLDHKTGREIAWGNSDKCWREIRYLRELPDLHPERIQWHYVKTPDGRFLKFVLDPNSRVGFYLTDGKNGYDGGVGIADKWKSVPKNEVPLGIKRKLNRG